MNEMFTFEAIKTIKIAAVSCEIVEQRLLHSVNVLTFRFF